MNKLCWFFLLLLTPLPAVFAEDIVMYVDQSEYYFRMGENAVIPLEIQNSHGRQISGMLQYATTQQIEQTNTQYSISNSQSTTLAINDGIQTISLDFGTSNSPSTIIADLSFIYNNGTQINVFLDPVTIHFVADDSQKNNTQNRMQSSSEQGAASSAQNNPSNPQQSLQQSLDDLINQQSPPTQDPQQRLQNNQLNQDSNALKKEIQEQLQEENNLKKAFESELASNEDFQESHQQLLQQGYDVTDGDFNPSSPETGDFEVNYQNEQGEWGKIQGSMEDGVITEMQTQTQEETEDLLEQLRADPRFQQYDEELGIDSFFEQNIEFMQDANKTTIQVQYNNENNQTATIFGEFESEIIENVFLEKPDDGISNWIFLVLVLFAAIASYVVYRLYKRSKKEPVLVSAPKTVPQPYDNALAVEKLIREGKENFENGNYKDAYGKINQALRLFLSHELHLKKEITNENILQHVPKESYIISDIKECFRIASLVEFAKYAPNQDDFSRMVLITEDIVYKKS